MPDWVSKTTVWECVFAIRGPRSEFANSCCKWVQIFGSTTLRCACSHQKPVRQTALASLLRPNLSIYGLARLVHGRMTGEWQLLSEHKPNMHHFNIYRSITCKKKTHRRVVSVQRGGELQFQAWTNLEQHRSSTWTRGPCPSKIQCWKCSNLRLVQLKPRDRGTDRANLE